MSINGRKNPNERKYTLFIDGNPVSNHAYDYCTAVIVFKDRFFEAKNAGHRVSFNAVRRNRRYIK